MKSLLCGPSNAISPPRGLPVGSGTAMRLVGFLRGASDTFSIS